MRAPRIGLRWVFVIVGVFGIAAAWWTRQQRIAARLRQLDVSIQYRYQYDNWSDLNRYSFNGDAELSTIGRLVGPDLASTIVSVASSESENPSEIARLASCLPHVRKIAIQDTPLKDEDVERFVALPRLRVLHLRGTDLTDSSVRTFSQMNQLGVLNLHNTSLSDAAIRELRSALPNTRIHTGPMSGGFM